MRNLTITMRKKLTGKAKILIYIEDHHQYELTFKGVPYRILGELKNGETKTFLITDEASTVVADIDEASNLCDDFYQLPEGTANITLSGECFFKSENERVFKFDQKVSADVLKKRKRTSVYAIIFTVIAIAVGRSLVSTLVDSFFNSSEETTKSESQQETSTLVDLVQYKFFTYKNFSIALNEDFKESTQQSENYDQCYLSNDVAVYITEEPFSSFEGFENYTVEEYGNLVIESNNFNNVTLERDGSLNYFKYNSSIDSGEIYTYFAYVYKGSNSFWLVQFATSNENSKIYAEKISDWAHTVIV